MTTSSLKNDDNGNNDDNWEEDGESDWEEDDEEEYGASLNDALLSSPPSVPSALELAEVPLLTSPHLSDTPIFVDMIEQWVGVSNAHGGRDLSAVRTPFYRDNLQLIWEWLRCSKGPLKSSTELEIRCFYRSGSTC
jgi:hypothetical protein